MKLSHDKVAAHVQENCEGWLSTRNRKKVCPPATSKSSIARKLASFPFTSKYKLTLNSSPSKHRIIPQRQISILNYVKKGQIPLHQDKQNIGAVKKLFQEKEIISDLQKRNTDFGSSPQKTTARTPINNDEYKFQNFLQPMNPCGYTHENSLRLEGIFEKIKEKDVDNYSREKLFSEDDISVEMDNRLTKISVKNVFLDSDRSSILLNKSNLSPSKTCCRQVSCSSADTILLKRKQYLKRDMVNACPPHECSGDLNPVVDVKYMEHKLSNSSCGKNDLLEEKAARDSLSDFSEYDHDLNLLIHSENSEEILQKKVFSNFQTDQIPGPSHICNSNPQYEEIIENNANSSLPNSEEMLLTQGVSTVNRYTFSEHDFETAARSYANTSHLFVGYFETSVCKQEDADEHLNLEEDNPEFTLQTQRSIDEEIYHESMQETDDFTFNSDFTCT